MSNLSITTKIIQQLSNNSGSVVPIAAKDTLSNCAITYIYNKEASKEDGRERAIEEFGTEVLWIGGIPLLKKLFDKTVYKFFKADPDFDIRNLKKNAQGKLDKLEFLAKNAPDKNQKQVLENILKNENVQKLYKRLHVAKFITATAATLAGLSGLIVYKQKTTQKELEQKYKKKMELQNACNKEIKKSPVFDKFMGNKETSFKGGGISKFLSGFMYNPVMNMSILDGGITATRLAQGRKGERFEIGFKEGFQILFIYCLAEPIQKGLEKLSAKFLKTPIKSEYQLLSNDKLKELITSEGLKDSVETLVKFDDNKALEYVFKNQDNALVKMLKISGELPTIKGSDTIDSLAFIDTKKLKNAAKNISELAQSTAGKGDLDKYLSKVKNIKGASVIANILIGAAAIGILQPTLNIILRKKNNHGETINPAIKQLEKDMEQKFAFSGSKQVKPQ